ncbi:MAG: hypothetical protein SNJ75_09725 [Gemmataceae bacterium]
MSKVFDALRRNGVAVSSVQASASPTLCPATPLSEEPAFIELGPKRQIIAASPAVLAGQPGKVTRPLEETPAAKLPGVTASAPASPAPILRRPRLAPELLAYHSPEHPAVARYAELLSGMREAASVKKPAQKAILSLFPVRGEIGCTTVLLNLAIVAARQGQRTMVLEANAKAPALTKRLGVNSAPGLMELLAGEVSFDQAVQTTDQDRLYVLTVGHQGPLLADVQTLHDLLAQMRTQYDLVLIDGPRWDAKPVALALAHASDAVFLVVPTSEADAPPASDWLRTLPQQGIRLAGTILTAC